MELEHIIIEKIRNEGPVSFRDFMDMCLYHPDHGYYTSNREKIGKHGDFYTSSSLTSCFGAMIARQMEEMWHLLAKKNFTIVEYGAGLGFHCKDILDHLKSNPHLYENLQYCIIEKSPFMRQKEKELLTEKVHWYDTIADIPGQIDCVFSNELVDNFPVHQVVSNQQLMEIFVDYNDGFVEILKPASEAVNNYFSELKVTLPDGFRTEANLDATRWISDVAKYLQKGFIITIDYGDVSEHLYHPRRSCGTIIGYKNHKITDQVFCDPGGQDITAHVNFSALSHWGMKSGLTTCGLTDQAHFLASLGFQQYLMEVSNKQKGDVLQLARQLSFVSHTLLFDMGSKFKILVQSKGVPDVNLKGLQHESRMIF
jgi:SAM-dependent MidA family methyltransferase